MRILNSDPLYGDNGGRFLLSLIKREAKGHIYDLYFINRSRETIPKLEVRRFHSAYNNFWEADFADEISTKLIENMKPEEKILVDELNEHHTGVDGFMFSFTLCLEDEVITINHSIKRKELLPKFFGPGNGHDGEVVGTFTPNIVIKPLTNQGYKLFTKAVEVAAKAHAKQLRKGTSIPYIFHYLETANILADNDCSEEMLVAGVLHDTLEDTDLTAEEISDLFGEHILKVVLGASEPDNHRLSWKERKQHTLDYLKKARKEILLVSCADKLSNIRSLAKDYEDLGDKLWSRFNAGYEEQKWYYQSLVISL
ncbi:HD domain-containing protein [Clostridium sp.]|uniref:HD domain-containing protein n=1 Tax=Clostridium sp. TaxID=1506 RepID=UPI002FCC53C1